MLIKRTKTTLIGNMENEKYSLDLVSIVLLLSIKRLTHKLSKKVSNGESHKQYKILLLYFDPLTNTFWNEILLSKVKYPILAHFWSSFLNER